MKNKISIYDFDGVIGDSRELEYDTHNHICHKYGLPFIHSKKDYLEVIDNGHLKERIPFEVIREYYRECNQYYESKIKSIVIYPEVIKLFKESDREILIISSTPDRFIKQVLEKHGIEKADIFGKEKARTKRERFSMLLEKKELKREDLFYIGDTIDDYNFCQQVGLPMLGSNYGFSDLTEIVESLIGLASTPEELVEKVKEYSLVR